MRVPGPFEIERVIEFEWPGRDPQFLLRDVTAEQFRATRTADDARFVTQDTKQLIMSFHSYLLKTPGGTLLVESLDDAIRITRAHKQHPRLVTLDGEVVSGAGAVTGGKVRHQSRGLLGRSGRGLGRRLAGLGAEWINATAASPYYAPHVQRPALFPPSDGYPPLEDPLVGVARLLTAARDLKRAVPEIAVVSSGWTYLQEFLPHVAQACIREGWFDAVGLGRMALSYPDLPADVLAGRPLSRKRLCRTFSDCTSAPRGGLVSGCYPLDPFYRARPERQALEKFKQTRQEAS